MQYIIEALRTTYHNERKAYSGLNDLINMLEADDLLSTDGFYAVLADINDLLHDISLESRDTLHRFVIDGKNVLCSNAHAYECAKDGDNVVCLDNIGFNK